MSEEGLGAVTSEPEQGGKVELSYELGDRTIYSVEQGG